MSTEKREKNENTPLSKFYMPPLVLSTLPYSPIKISFVNTLGTSFPDGARVYLKDFYILTLSEVHSLWELKNQVCLKIRENFMSIA